MRIDRWANGRMCKLQAALVFLMLIGVGLSVWAESDPSRLPDKAVPLQEAMIPRRPMLMLELGESLLKQGALMRGIKLPTGTVWQPAIWVFGTARTAGQTFETGLPGDDTRSSEWSNRLEIFANLRLTGTERVIIGFRPLDQSVPGSGRQFTGYRFEPEDIGNDEDQWQSEFNGDISSFFFEGEIGEIFAFLDDDDSSSLDIGLSVGRQGLFFQEGLLINDTIDAVGLTRNTLQWFGAPNMRITALYGWNNIHRGNNVEDESAHLFGLLTETDFFSKTVGFDVVYVLSDDVNTGDGLYAGLSTVQRIGRFSTSLRVNASIAIDDETAAVGQGVLLLGEVSWQPGRHSNLFANNLIYINGFWGIEQFTSAARSPTAGGPLGRTGILFESVGLGRYGAPLSNQAMDVAGGSIGYQMFFALGRKQLIFEVGGRKDTSGDNEANDAVAFGMRYQQAFGRRLLVRLDAFAAVQRDRDEAYGGRLETLIKF
ncbi:MAG: hypothetical protein O7E52_26725 [Candidatus Poribacteria bacterium]|nr:hypothetical protein [Candidatus Poribacteria bacterium]